MGEAGRANELTLDQQGWVTGVAHEPSPNCDERATAGDVSLLVIHNISLPPGQFGGGFVEDLFLNRLDHDGHPYFAQLRELRVSAHFLIDRSGMLTQFVSTDCRAWHAGLSSFLGRERCNDFSVGIELEGTDETPFTSAQYLTLSTITMSLQRRYPLVHVAGHEHIAPGRKTDPGPFFDWHAYRALLDKRWRDTGCLPPALSFPDIAV